MSTLTAILIACTVGAVVSTGLAALLALHARPSWIPTLISYAVGTLLGAVFMDIVPHIFERSFNYHASAATILGGILTFFLLEKLVLWRHSHDHFDGGHEGHGHGGHEGHAVDGGRSGAMIVIGDSVHNFVDGVIIAAAFLADFRLGVVTALAVIAHEVPQEVGDVLVLLHSGYSKRQALLLNLASSGATLVGALVAYYWLQSLQAWIPTLLCIAAASMIYVAVADLIPGLHKRTALSATLAQVSLIGLGIATIVALHSFLGH